MEDGRWFRVEDTHTETHYFARIESYREPYSFRVVAIHNKGYVEVPAEGVIGLEYSGPSFWRRYRKVDA